MIEGCTFLTSVQPIVCCTQLKSLDISFTAVDNVGLGSIVVLCNLESLNLCHCCFVSDLTPLSACVVLRELNIRFTVVTDADLQSSCLPSLEILWTSRCIHVRAFLKLRERVLPRNLDLRFDPADESLPITEAPFDAESLERLL